MKLLLIRPFHLHHKFHIINPYSIAYTTVEGLSAAGYEMYHHIIWLDSFFRPTFFLDNDILSFAVQCMIGSFGI